MFAIERLPCASAAVGSPQLILCLVRCVSVCASMAQGELQPGPAAQARRHTDFPCEFPSCDARTSRSRLSRVLVPCAGVAAPQIISECVGFTFCVLPPVTPNQAMQLTAVSRAFKFQDDFNTSTAGDVLPHRRS